MRLTLICAAFWALAACQSNDRYIIPDVPPELLTPPVVAGRPVETQGQLAILAIDQNAALQQCTGQILTIAAILADAQTPPSPKG